MYDMSRQVNKKENDEQTPERKIEKKSYNDILEYYSWKNETKSLNLDEKN